RLGEEAPDAGLRLGEKGHGGSRSLSRTEPEQLLNGFRGAIANRSAVVGPKPLRNCSGSVLASAEGLLEPISYRTAILYRSAADLSAEKKRGHLKPACPLEITQMPKTR